MSTPSSDTLVNLKSSGKLWGAVRPAFLLSISALLLQDLVYEVGRKSEPLKRNVACHCGTTCKYSARNIGICQLETVCQYIQICCRGIVRLSRRPLKTAKIFELANLVGPQLRIGLKSVASRNCSHKNGASGLLNQSIPKIPVFRHTNVTSSADISTDQ